MKKMAALTQCFFLWGLIASVYASQTVTILVNTANLGNVEKAAQSEEKVNFWDSNLTDDRACTESFAATELAHFLPHCANIAEADIVLNSASKLPSQGNVFIIGSRKSNSLISSFDTGSVDELKTDDSFRIKTFKDNGRIITVIEGKDRIGSLYGVYAYLEQLGIRFYGLGDKYSGRAGKTITVNYPLVKYHLDANKRFVTENKEFNEPYKIPSTGTVYPAKPVDLPENLNIVENPSYQLRGFWAWEDRGDEEFFLWMARNRMNFWTASEKEIHFLKKLGMVLTWGGHTFQEEFINSRAEYPYDHPEFKGDQNKPKDPYPVSKDYKGDINGDGKLTYFEAHPEWFGLRNGKRSDNINENEGDNYCTSNTDASRELANNLIKSLIDGNWHRVDIVSFWLSDGGKWCECENCTKQGNYTDQLFAAVHVILSEFKKAQQEGRLQRRIQLFTLAYHQTLPPPTHKLPEDFDYENFMIYITPIERCFVHPFADPCCTEVNKYLLDKYLAWTTGQNRNYKGQSFICDYYNVSSFFSMPLLFTREMASDIPYFYSKGTKNLSYMHTPTRLLGTWTLNQYLFARLMWNVNTDVNGLLDEYFSLYYPSSKDCTKKFYGYLEKASSNFKPLKHYIRVDDKPYILRFRLIDNNNGDLFELTHFKYDTTASGPNSGPSLVDMMESIRLARKELHAALLQCTDKDERERLIEDEKRFTYGEAMYSFLYHLIRTSMFHKNNNVELARLEFAKVEQYAEKLKSVKDLVHVSSSHANEENGFTATQVINVFMGTQKLGIYDFFKEEYGK